MACVEFLQRRQTVATRVRESRLVTESGRISVFRAFRATRVSSTRPATITACTP